MNAFEEYLHSEDLEKRERAQLWRTSIGLQDVDNLRGSNFLIEAARKHIEGDISMDEVYVYCNHLDIFCQVKSGLFSDFFNICQKMRYITNII